MPPRIPRSDKKSQLLSLFVLIASTALSLVTPSESGIRLRLVGSVRDQAGRPVAGAVLHVYQTDATGRYTPDKPMDEPHARLSGRLTTTATGTFEIDIIRPGGYPKAIRIEGQDRKIPAHIHIDITAPNGRERRLQVVFSDDPLLADPYWKQWAASHGNPVVTVSPGAGGLTAQVVIALE